MFANVEIDSKPKLDVLTVPREAVIRSGQGDRVILALGGGRFRPQIVESGVASGARIEILSGLARGDVVVTSGQFLLDSEANGEQAFARLMSSGETGTEAESAMSMNRDTDGLVPELSGTAVTEVAVYSTIGDITRIEEGETMTLSHEAGAALGWPAMEMGFEIPAELDISEFEIGDRVAFEFSVTPQGMYRLNAVRYRDESQ